MASLVTVGGDDASCIVGFEERGPRWQSLLTQGPDGLKRCPAWPTEGPRLVRLPYRPSDSGNARVTDVCARLAYRAESEDLRFAGEAQSWVPRLPRPAPLDGFDTLLVQSP
jgi:hypothetical protein